MSTRPSVRTTRALQAHAEDRGSDDLDGLVQAVHRAHDALAGFGVFDEIAEQVRREIVPYVFPAPGSVIDVHVRQEVVRLAGRVRDTSMIPVAAGLVRTVKGVVDVDFELEGQGDPGGPRGA